jgi:hypothetical protein
MEQGTSIGYRPARANQRGDEEQNDATRLIRSRILSLWPFAIFLTHSVI